MITTKKERYLLTIIVCLFVSDLFVIALTRDPHVSAGMPEFMLYLLLFLFFGMIMYYFLVMLDPTAAVISGVFQSTALVILVTLASIFLMVLFTRGISLGRRLLYIYAVVSFFPIALYGMFRGVQYILTLLQ